MSKKPKRFDPRSRWVKYRDGLWIPHRKRVYLYWFKFLQHAEKDPDWKVDWRKYRGWGGSNEMLGSKFDEWWEKHWKDLFAVENEGDKPKFSLTTTKPKVDGYRTALLVYENREFGSNWEIAKRIQRIEERRRYGVQSFFYAYDDVEEGKEDKMIIQSRVGRYKKLANRILDSVCEGRFP
jgi:hypothetical protein